MRVGVFCFAGILSTLYPVGRVVAVILRLTSIRVRRVTILFSVGLCATGFSAARLRLETTLSAKALGGTGHLFASVHEICYSTKDYGEVYRDLFEALSLQKRVVSLFLVW